MRARTFTLLVLALAALLSTSCVAALKQVFRDQDVVALPKLAGLWHVAKYGEIKGNRLPDRPWVFRADQPSGVSGWLVDVEDEDDRNATLEAVFFRVGKELYLETKPGKTPMNSLAALHQMPVRVVTRVELSKGELKVFPLDPEVVEQTVAKELGMVEHGGSLTGFTTFDADANAWHAVLSKHGKKLFTGEPLIVLSRKPPPPPKD